jgi:hypothetical protein
VNREQVIREGRDYATVITEVGRHSEHESLALNSFILDPAIHIEQISERRWSTMRHPVVSTRWMRII